MPGDSGAPPPEPPFDASDPAGWFQQLGDYAEQLSASIAGAYQTLVDRAAAGELAPGQIQEATNAHLQRRLPEYLSELGRLYFDLLKGLTELRVESEQEFLTGVLQRVKGRATRRRSSSPSQARSAVPRPRHCRSRTRATSWLASAAT